MASTYAARPQPKTLQRPMLFDGLYRIERTAWGESAAPADPGAQEIPVEADRSDQQGPDHCKARWSRASASLRTCFLSSVRLRGSILLWSLKTRSQAGRSPRFCRKASRMTRLMALRTTALAAKRLAMMSPSRAHAAASWPEERRGVITTNNAPLARRFTVSAAACSWGRCKRVLAEYVARVDAAAPALCLPAGACSVWLKRPAACALWSGAY